MVYGDGIMSDHTFPVQVGEFLYVRATGEIVTDQLGTKFLHCFRSRHGYGNFDAFNERFHIEIVFEVVGINVRIIKWIVASQSYASDTSAGDDELDKENGNLH